MAWYSFNLKGQNRLEGKVLDAATRQPVPFAGVFIQELNTGCLTGEDGSFSIKKVPVGSFIVQFSRIGYKSLSKKVMVKDSVTYVEATLGVSLLNTSEVIVYGEQGKDRREVVRTIEQVTTATMREEGALSLADGLTKLAGVSQITSGSGIAKPVIRGLSGSRVQAVVLGIRFDNQNWGEEHGLGLSYIGIEKTEVIKGPYSLLYGSEAMGGVINIIEEYPAPAGSLQSEANAGFFSNTLGYSANAAVKKNNGKINWRVRIGNESHADYADGNNQRVINSRFNDYIAKATLGFTHKNWVSKNNYFFAFNNYGFVGEAYDLIKLNNPLLADSRYSRDLYYPHHQVFINMFTSQNTLFLKRSTIKFTAGTHFNNRQEQDLGYHADLDMQLNTYNGTFLWEKPLGNLIDLTLGTNHLVQTNRNLAVRNVIPDANLLENSGYAYAKIKFNKIFIDGGARFDTKSVQTFYTANKYAPSTDIVPFSNFYKVFSGSVGTTIQLGKYLLFKANGSNAFRAPNLAELSSNGLHEGTMRYEIGNINLKQEQMFGSEASLQVSSGQLSGYAAVFYNYFLNYIFLAPTSEEYVGLPIYRYLQQNAGMHGGDASLTYNPNFIKWLSLHETFSMVQGTRTDGVALPFIPPPRLTSEVRADFKAKRNPCFVKASVTYVEQQNQLALFEKYTPSYYLLNFGLGFSTSSAHNEWLFSLTCNNALNTVYYDHLSRYKYFNVNNMGRNIVLNVSYKFLKQRNNEK